MFPNSSQSYLRILSCNTKNHEATTGRLFNYHFLRAFYDSTYIVVFLVEAIKMRCNATSIGKVDYHHHTDSHVERAVQFERVGYFARDKDSAPGKPVFNRTVGLRDSYAKAAG